MREKVLKRGAQAQAREEVLRGRDGAAPGAQRRASFWSWNKSLESHACWGAREPDVRLGFRILTPFFLFWGGVFLLSFFLYEKPKESRSNPLVAPMRESDSWALGFGSVKVGIGVLSLVFG